jgi:hypothetical protein
VTSFFKGLLYLHGYITVGWHESHRRSIPSPQRSRLVEKDPTQSPVCRLDRFVVPLQSQDEFLSEIRTINGLLKEQPGFLQGFVLEQKGERGSVRIVTLVEWKNVEAICAAGTAVARIHSDFGFNTTEMLNRLGIRANFETYTNIEKF